jgi:hypothetical protein
MSDIVERLWWSARSEESHFCRKICEEAAAEIERLRASNAELLLIARRVAVYFDHLDGEQGDLGPDACAAIASAFSDEAARE